MEEGRLPELKRAKADVLSVGELAERWQKVNRPRQKGRTGDWVGWSPKTVKTTADNFRLYILPRLGHRDAATLTGVMLDDLYASLEEDRGLSSSVVARCHGQVRAMFSWALRKKLVATNPAAAADPPRLKPGKLHIPPMDNVRAVQDVAPAAFAAHVQLAATIGARRGTLIALRWGVVDLAAETVTFSRAIAESIDG